MKKASGIIKTILIIAAVVLLLHLLLRWKPLDEFLTSKIGSPSQQTNSSDTLIEINNYHALNDAAEKPYVYFSDSRLYTVYKGENIDITPPDVSPVFYDEQSGIRERIKYRDHACFDAGTGKLLFVVDVQNIPRLFMADLSLNTETGEEENGSVSVLLSNNVNSFIFLCGEPVFAEGYEKYNSLYLFRDGEKVNIAENSSYVPVPELNGMICADLDEKLSFFEKDGMKKYPLADNVSGIRDHCVFGDGKLLVYADSGENHLSVLFDTLTGRAIRSVIDHVPDKCWSGGEKAIIFDSKAGKISKIDTEGQVTDMFSGQGHIYKVFDVAKNGPDALKVFFATKKGIFAGNYSGAETVKLLCAFKGELRRYSTHPWLISYHMEAAGDFENGFYLMALSGRSQIYNSNNPLSWLNRFSSFVYDLMYVSGGKAVSCGVPVSRTMTLPEQITGDVVLYSARFGDGSIKSLSTLSCGEVLCRDVLKSDGMAKDSSRIEYEISGGSVIITAVRDPGHAEEKTDYCVMEGPYSSVSTVPVPPIVSFDIIYTPFDQAAGD